MGKKSFIKYEYEGIRTEYMPLTTAAESKIESRNVVKVTEGAVAKDSGAIDNKTVFLLAEDINVGDLGFVYYIIEDEDNLVDDGGNE